MLGSFALQALEAYGVSGLQEWTVNEISAAGGAVMNILVSGRFTELDRHVINGHVFLSFLILLPKVGQRGFDFVITVETRW